MLKRMRPRITFSNVVALLALFFALGGTVYAAAKISGKTIKPKSIPANRIKPNSLSSKQIKDNTLTSVKTSSGLAKVTYAVATGTLDPSVTTPILITATCPSKQKAIGGGATIADHINGGFVTDATFTADRGGYVGTFFSSFGGPTDTGTVTAACVPVSATG
jgi:hypothetical protein